MAKPKQAAGAVAAPIFVHTLAEPVHAHGEELKKLEFRKPTARDILSVGNPVIFNPMTDPPTVTHDERKLVGMISALAGIPPSSVLAMDSVDLVSCAWGITPFFVPKPGSI